MSSRITGIGRTATLRRGEILETDHADDGSGKIDVGAIVALIMAAGRDAALDFDGSSSGVVALSNSYAPGTGDFSVRVKLIARSFATAPNLTHNNDSTAPCLRLVGDGSFRVGPGDAGAVYTAVAPAGSIVLGELIDIVWTRASGQSRLYRNGYLVAGPTADANDYSTPIVKLGYRDPGAGETKLDAVVFAFQLDNRALSAAEVLALHERKTRPATDYNPGGNGSILTNGAFAADTDWNKETGWTISGGKANYNSASGTQWAITQAPATPVLSLRKYLVTFTISNFVAGGITPGLGSGGTGVIGTERTADGTYTEELIAPAGVNNLFRFIAKSGVTTTLSVDNVSVVPLGLVCDLEMIGAGPVAPDRSGNNVDGILPNDGATSGAVWSCNSKDELSFAETFSASGYALGRDAVHIPLGWRVAEVWASGDGTFSLGGSGGDLTSVVNAQTAAAAPAPIALAAYITSTRKLYRSLGTATSVAITYILRRIR